MASRHLSYRSNWKSEPLTCPSCGWKGTFEEARNEAHETLLDASCPQCGVLDAPVLAMVSWPVSSEMEAEVGTLTPEERQDYEDAKAHMARHRSEKLMPDSPLPDLPGDIIVLEWDFQPYDPDDKTWCAGDTVIRHGDTVVCREPVVYEGYLRFVEVLAILRTRYGTRLHDLVPTSAGAAWLYGDRVKPDPRIARAECMQASDHPTDEVLER